jgi:hypothetical protein
MWGACLFWMARQLVGQKLSLHSVKNATPLTHHNMSLKRKAMYEYQVVDHTSALMEKNDMRVSLLLNETTLFGPVPWEGIGGVRADAVMTFDPAVEVAKWPVFTSVTTKNGGSFKGTKTSEGSTSLTLVTADNKEMTFPFGELRDPICTPLLPLTAFEGKKGQTVRLTFNKEHGIDWQVVTVTELLKVPKVQKAQKAQKSPSPTATTNAATAAVDVDVDKKYDKKDKDEKTEFVLAQSFELTSNLPYMLVAPSVNISFQNCKSAPSRRNTGRSYNDFSYMSAAAAAPPSRRDNAASALEECSASFQLKDVTLLPKVALTTETVHTVRIREENTFNDFVSNNNSTTLRTTLEMKAMDTFVLPSTVQVLSGPNRDTILWFSVPYRSKGETFEIGIGDRTHIKVLAQNPYEYNARNNSWWVEFLNTSNSVCKMRIDGRRVYPDLLPNQTQRYTPASFTEPGNDVPKPTPPTTTTNDDDDSDSAPAAAAAPPTTKKTK